MDQMDQMDQMDRLPAAFDATWAVREACPQALPSAAADDGFENPSSPQMGRLHTVHGHDESLTPGVSHEIPQDRYQGEQLLTVRDFTPPLWSQHSETSDSCHCGTTHQPRLAL